jgi:predicted Zn-dependent protease
MSGFSQDMLARIKYLHKKHILSRLSIQQLFDDAMYLIEQEICKNLSFEQTQLYFELAAERGHFEAQWIAPILKEAKRDRIRALQLFATCGNPKALFFVYLATCNKNHLQAAAATGWTVAVSALTISSPCSSISDREFCEWITNHGDRQSKFMYATSCFYNNNQCIQLGLERHPYRQFHNVAREELKSDCVSIFEAFRFGIVHLSSSKYEYRPPIRKLLHVTLYERKQQHDFGKALLHAAYAIEIVCAIAVDACKKSFIAPVHETFAKCFEIYEATCHKKTQSLYTTLLVCKAYGCNKDMQRFITEMVAATFSSDEWIGQLNEWKGVARKR